jgi:hypothetical protein
MDEIRVSIAIDKQVHEKEVSEHALVCFALYAFHEKVAQWLVLHLFAHIAQGLHQLFIAVLVNEVQPVDDQFFGFDKV